jgi:hypothetical protein
MTGLLSLGEGPWRRLWAPLSLQETARAMLVGASRHLTRAVRSRELPVRAEILPFGSFSRASVL